MESVFGTVPFLNGGLFEPNDLDNQEHITVPDAAIEQVLSGLFDRFNFTVMESTPFDIEVAVDPEMLGKVFEELVTGRHDSGAYYTPRPVVSFMCREALKGYLVGQETGLDPEVIARFVDVQDTESIQVAQARRIARALAEVTVVDPACGSGAYLLGMMQELIELQNTLYNLGVDAKGLYDLKLEIIQRNLYGVDLDDFAVNIAMLRMWLSLAIDYEGATPEPLPNLDFKVVCGDSLLAPDPSVGVDVQGTLGQDTEQFQRLGQLKGEYMRASDGSKKATLRQDIEFLTSEIREFLGVLAMDGVVDWRVEFAEVFAQRRGFDIAIANPPYGITVKERRSVFIAQTDSYTNFMALVTELVPAGVMAYITPSSWETGERFKKFRKFLFGKIRLLALVNLPYDVFDNPYVDTAITIGSRTLATPDEFMLATFEKRAQLDLTQITDHLEPEKWSIVADDSDLRLPLFGWAANLFSRVSDSAVMLGQVTSSKRGIESYKYKILDRISKNAVPYFSGQVSRYEIVPSENSTFVVINELDSPYHRGRRVLTRRIVSRANRLMSAVTTDEFVVKKDIYSVKPKFEDDNRLSAFLGILNSSLLSFLYLSRSAAATKDDFRQVTLAGLRELPIFFPDEEKTEAELVRLVKAREENSGQADELDRQIDAIVYRIYGVTESEKFAIEEWLARSG